MQAVDELADWVIGKCLAICLAAAFLTAVLAGFAYLFSKPRD